MGWVPWGTGVKVVLKVGRAHLDPLGACRSWHVCSASVARRPSAVEMIADWMRFLQAANDKQWSVDAPGKFDSLTCSCPSMTPAIVWGPLASAHAILITKVRTEKTAPRRWVRTTCLFHISKAHDM